MLSREQVSILTGWTEGRLKRMIESGRIFEHPQDGIHPADVYKFSPKGREALRQLLAMPWYAEWWAKYRRYLDLEEAGLIAIERPIHTPTGIPYDIAYWRPVFTELGWDVARELWDLIEHHGLDQEVR